MAINFANVKNWVIPDGDVIRVTDSQNRIIWEKKYEFLDFVVCETNPTGIIVPLTLTTSNTYEIMMDFEYYGNMPTQVTQSNTTGGVTLMGGAYQNNARRWLYWGPNGNNLYNMIRLSDYSNHSANTNTFSGSYLNNRIQYIWSGPSDNYNSGQIVATDVLSETTIGSYSGTYTGLLSQTSSWNNYFGFGVEADYQGNVATFGHFTGRIYGCYIKIDNVLIYDFIPAKRLIDGVYGLYDKINDVFYPSCTVNPFNYPIINVQSISVDNDEVGIGYTKKLTWTVSPNNSTNRNVTWSSSDNSIATVDSSGNVTGVSYGTCTITATATDGSGVTGSCTLFVYVPTTGITIFPDRLNLNVGSDGIIYPVIEPNNATYKTVTWRKREFSGQASMVKNSDQTVTVTGVSETDSVGSNPIQIWAETYDGQLSNITKVYVTEQHVPTSGVSVSPSSVTLGIGDTQQLIATVSPSDASNKNVSWSTSDSNVAIVNSSGVVTAISTGSCTITCTTVDGHYTDTCTVTVVPTVVHVSSISLNTSYLIMERGDTSTLTATVLPTNANDKSVTWSSSDNSIATVSSSGVVTAVNGGTCTITCTTNDGGYTDTCTVSVSKHKLTINVTPNTASIDTNYGNSYGTFEVYLAKGVVINYSIYKQGYLSEYGSYTMGTQDHTITVTLTEGCVSVTSVSMTNKPNSIMYVGSTNQCSYSFGPNIAAVYSVSWSSSNNNVATVNGGLITAVGQGSARITVTLTTCSNATKTDYCDISVVVPSKHMTLYNTTSGSTYYGNDSSTSNTISSGSSTNVTIYPGESLYISRLGSGSFDVLISTDEGSMYSTRINTYVFDYDNIVDGDLVTLTEDL